MVRFREFRGLSFIPLRFLSLRNASSLIGANVYLRNLDLGLRATILVGFRYRSPTCVLYRGRARSLRLLLCHLEGEHGVLIGVVFLLVETYSTRRGIVLVRGVSFVCGLALPATGTKEFLFFPLLRWGVGKGSLPRVLSSLYYVFCA